MSTNIHFSATREIIVVKTGKNDVQTIQYDVCQTPTDVTWDIKNSADPVQAYKDWILRERSHDELEDVFHEDDIFCEREAIGQRIYNAGKEHIAQFEEWLKMCEKEGYTVTAEAW